MTDSPKVPELHEQKAHPYNRLGEVSKLYEQGEFESSLDKCNRLIEDIPTFADIYGVKGVVLTALAQYDAATDAFARCRELRPDLWTTDWYESFTLRLLGKEEEAVAMEAKSRATYAEKFSA